MPFLKKCIFFFLSLLLLESCSQKPLSNPSVAPSLTGKELFVQWAQQQQLTFDFEEEKSLQGLVEKIGQDIGTARVVLLSEGFHNCEEMLQLQYELVTYLVQQKGFTVVATESGLPESKYLNAYIHGQDSIANLWQKGISKLYGQWQASRDLVNWMAAYNKNNNNVLNYYGADIGGGYQDWEFPFQQVFEYLDTVDAPTSKKLQQDLTPYFAKMKPYAAYYYVTKFSPQQKNDLALLLEELIQEFTNNKSSYLQKSNSRDYEWVLQVVKSMRWAEHYYRNHANITDTTTNRTPLFLGASGRELAMAKNIQWLLEYQPNAKIIVINHVLHTKTATQYQGEFYQFFTPMGQILKQHLQEDLFVIGMAYGAGQYWKLWQVPDRKYLDTIPPVDSNGLEVVLQEIGNHNYYLPLQDPPQLTYQWLHQPTTIRENDYHIVLQPSEWNACFYLPRVSPAVEGE